MKAKIKTINISDKIYIKKEDVKNIDELISLYTYDNIVPDLKQILQDDIRTDVYVSERFGDANQLSESELISYFDDNRGRFAAPDRTVEFDEVREAVRMNLWAVRREMLVGDWLTGLMRRGEVVRFEP